MANLETVRRLPLPPLRPDDAHKGTFGTVIVVGGSAMMMGAPALCAAGALRGGVGLVKIAAPARVLPVAIAIEPGATGIALGTSVDDDLAQLDAADPHSRAVLAVGPGIGMATEARYRVRALLQGGRAMVLDADGFNHLVAWGKPRPAPGPELVMTPHPGEFARLAEPLGIRDSPTDPSSRPAAAAALAQAHAAIVVLKGRHTVVCDGRRVYVNTTGNPALATAGSGDILTGLIAALIAQKMTPFDAAVLGVYLHGLAADLWVQQHGPSGLTALELARQLPDAFQRHRRDNA